MTVRLEVGKQYRMRNGEKCLVVDTQNDNDEYPFIVYRYDEKESEGVMANGKYSHMLGEHERDIISEWTEPMTADLSEIAFGKTEYAPPTKTLRDEFAMCILNGMLSNTHLTEQKKMKELIANSYVIADAMMKQREIKE